MKIPSITSILKDINAGIVVFFVAIPLCLGIALASGAPIMSGLLAGVIGGMVVGVLSGSELGVSGPAAGLVATVISGIALLGSFDAFCLATLIAGGMQMILGMIKVGTLAQFFPASVIKGMLAAIGIIIILKQIPHLVGLDADYRGGINFNNNDGHTTLSELGLLLDALTPGAILIGLAGIVIIVLWNRPKIQHHHILGLIPSPLLAVILGICLHFLFEQTSLPLALAPEHLVQITVSSNPIEWMTLPDFTAIRNPQVWLYALVICLIASLETLLCAEATDKIDPQMRISNKNRELLAQGVGNALVGLIGGLPITQMIVRSSTNVQAGGQTRLATVFHGSMILLAVILVPSLLNMIPLTSISAILVIVGYNLAKPTLFKKYYKKGWAQFSPFLVTFVAIFFTDLIIGVGIGIATAIFFILRRNYADFQVYEYVERTGKITIIKLASIVPFFQNVRISQALNKLANGSKVTIDASNVTLIAPEVVEVIETFFYLAPLRGIEIELIGSLEPKTSTSDIFQKTEKIYRKYIKNIFTKDQPFEKSDGLFALLAFFSNTNDFQERDFFAFQNGLGKLLILSGEQNDWNNGVNLSKVFAKAGFQPHKLNIVDYLLNKESGIGIEIIVPTIVDDRGNPMKFMPSRKKLLKELKTTIFNPINESNGLYMQKFIAFNIVIDSERDNLEYSVLSDFLNSFSTLLNCLSEHYLHKSNFNITISPIKQGSFLVEVGVLIKDGMQSLSDHEALLSALEIVGGASFGIIRGARALATKLKARKPNVLTEPEEISSDELLLETIGIDEVVFSALVDMLDKASKVVLEASGSVTIWMKNEMLVVLTESDVEGIAILTDRLNMKVSRFQQVFLVFIRACKDKREGWGVFQFDAREIKAKILDSRYDVYSLPKGKRLKGSLDRILKKEKRTGLFLEEGWQVKDIEIVEAQ
jgi:MFS superfamily sulfate permease-like transporter